MFTTCQMPMARFHREFPFQGRVIGGIRSINGKDFIILGTKFTSRSSSVELTMRELTPPLCGGGFLPIPDLSLAKGRAIIGG